MLTRSVRCSLLFAATLFASAGSARADEPPAPVEPPHEDAPPPGLRGPRIGFTPGLGAGFVAFTGNTGFPSSVFTTVIQGELLLELTRVGFFIRGGFLSGGPSGRWTAPVVALGTQYRLIGDGEERWGLVVRTAFLYERWSAVSSVVGCDVLYFFPNSCQDYVAPPDSAPGTVTVTPAVAADSLGGIEGLRLEAPVAGAYIAFDAEVSVAGDVDHSSAGVAIAGQLVLTFALRDHPDPGTHTRVVPRRHYYPMQY